MAALPDFVKAIALNNKLDESREFATSVQRSMIERLRPANKTVRDLGVKQAPFVVLIGAAMPSVLAEVSFITNPQEAKLLRGRRLPAAHRRRAVRGDPEVPDVTAKRRQRRVEIDSESPSGTKRRYLESHTPVSGISVQVLDHVDVESPWRNRLHLS